MAQGRQIINADALQVYSGWRILTARPTPQDMAQAPHLLYGHINYKDTYSVGDWLRELMPHLDCNPAPVIVGGTGLYFQALLKGLADIPPTDPAIRAEANERRHADGIDAMVAALDPQTRARIDLANPMRVQRAWEVLRQTGRGLASWQEDTGPPLCDPQTAQCFVLNPDKDVLNARIDARFDRMLTTGAWDEVKKMNADWDPDRQSSRAIGARELIDALRGNMPISDAVLAAKISTHQYAKRQRTWIRNKMMHWSPLITTC